MDKSKFQSNHCITHYRWPSMGRRKSQWLIRICVRSETVDEAIKRKISIRHNENENLFGQKKSSKPSWMRPKYGWIKPTVSSSCLQVDGSEVSQIAGDSIKFGQIVSILHTKTGKRQVNWCRWVMTPLTQIYCAQFDDYMKKLLSLDARGLMSFIHCILQKL